MSAESINETSTMKTNIWNAIIYTEWYLLLYSDRDSLPLIQQASLRAETNCSYAVWENRGGIKQESDGQKGEERRDLPQERWGLTEH